MTSKSLRQHNFGLNPKGLPPRRVWSKKKDVTNKPRRGLYTPKGCSRDEMCTILATITILAKKVHPHNFAYFALILAKINACMCTHVCLACARIHMHACARIKRNVMHTPSGCAYACTPLGCMHSRNVNACPFGACIHTPEGCVQEP